MLPLDQSGSLRSEGLVRRTVCHTAVGDPEPSFCQCSDARGRERSMMWTQVVEDWEWSRNISPHFSSEYILLRDTRSMKRQQTRMDTGEQVHVPTLQTYPEMNVSNALHSYREPGPILMCWRAFRPEGDEDRDVESMSSASMYNI